MRQLKSSLLTPYLASFQNSRKIATIKISNGFWRREIAQPNWIVHECFEQFWYLRNFSSIIDPSWGQGIRSTALWRHQEISSQCENIRKIHRWGAKALYRREESPLWSEGPSRQTLSSQSVRARAIWSHQEGKQNVFITINWSRKLNCFSRNLRSN